MEHNEASELLTESPDNGLGCDFHEHYFGAPYIDGRCIDGYLYDEDNCDDNGLLYMSDDAPPCPKCNHYNWLMDFEDEWEMLGYEDFEKGITEYVHKQIKHEQPEDLERVKAWWQNGWNQAKTDQEQPDPTSLPQDKTATP